MHEADPPIYIGSDIYRHSTYGASHPLAIPRVSTCTDLCRALGWLPAAQYCDSPMASEAQLGRFHDAGYLAALRRAEAEQSVDAADRARYAIGEHNNPVYREIFRRPATSAGGVLLAAELTRGGGVVHCPGGGTHHGRPDRASGFCYVNDCVLGLLAWLDQGLRRIVYLDLDAHHGDGVQDAFAADDRVLTISLHEAQRWPHTGPVEDRAGGMARNLPLPRGCNDSEYGFLLEHAVWPLIEAFRPQALMLQCGADGLEEDPLAKLALSNGAIWGAVRRAVQAARDAAAATPVHAQTDWGSGGSPPSGVQGRSPWPSSAAITQPPHHSPRLIVLGGGGYNPYTVGRCWAGIWGVLNDRAVPETLPPAAQAVLRGLRYNRAAGRNPPEHWFTTLRDAPRPGPIRPEIERLAQLTLA